MHGLRLLLSEPCKAVPHPLKDPAQIQAEEPCDDRTAAGRPASATLRNIAANQEQIAKEAAASERPETCSRKTRARS